MRAGAGWLLVMVFLTASALPSSSSAQMPPPQNAPPYPYQSPPPGYPPPSYPPPGYPPPGYPSPGYPPPGYRPPIAVEPAATATHLGLGYKIGNGLGFLGGDVILSPLPHLALDLQVNSFTVRTDSGNARGYGFAPAVQGFLREPGRSTPYIGAGYLYASVTLDNLHASLSGGFINAGYEWKWSSGFGILLGGGASYIGTVNASNGVTSISRKGGVFPNLEFSLRFMFL